MADLQNALDELFVIIQGFVLHSNWIWFGGVFLLALCLLIVSLKSRGRKCGAQPTDLDSGRLNHGSEDLELIRLLVLLPDVAKRITSIKDLSQLTDVFVEQVHLLLPFYQEIALFVPLVEATGKQSLVLRKSMGLHQQQVDMRLPMEQGMVGLAASQNMILWRDELEDRFGRQRAQEDAELGIYEASVAMPICLNGQLFACLALAKPSAPGDRISEKRLLSILADLAGISFSHASQIVFLNQFNRNLQKMVDEKVAQLQETEHRLIQTEQLAAFGEFVATIAHDIKTPLAFISGEAQWAQEILTETNPDRKGLKNSLDIIQKNSQRLQNDIQNLLQKIRIPEMKVETFPIIQILAEIVRMVESLATKKKIKIIQELSDQTLPMEGYPGLLRHAFTNLISNAFEAMPQGGSLTIRTILEDRVYKISVQDTGKGIQAEDLPHIFELFYSKRAGGTGLGLSSVKRIIEKQHGGKISVYSQVGHGSCFTVEIPLKNRSET